MAPRILLAALTFTATALVGLMSPASAASSGWTTVSVGDFHTCGIRGGRVYCWGDDTYGQLGDGAAGGFRATPAVIASGATDWTSVSAAENHTCGVRAGRVACWGSDQFGQLGDGTAGGQRPTPALIASGATDWKSVSGGQHHTCGVRAGRVACWGLDADGQLGDGTAGGQRPTPALIASGATDWTSASSGSNHSCGTRAGRVACWGYDGSGQLGDGTAGGTRPTPALIASGATDWTSVSAGAFHSCGARAGRVACWGLDENGQLGDGTTGGFRATPALIASAATDWKSVNSALAHSCARRAGRIACWGSDFYGQLGDGTAGGQRPTPALIASGATDWTAVSAGGGHTCGIRATFLACWGNDNVGQLGDGTAGFTPDPVPSLVL